MSFQSFVTERLAVITAQLNAIGTNAKKIDELPVQSTLSPVSKIHVSRGGVSESLEVQKIIDSIKNNTYNQLISIGIITTLNNEVSIPADARWQINGIRYNTIAVTKIPMPYSAAGTTRTDIIVANILSKIVRIAGAETAGIAVRPNIPVDSVLVTEINVSNTVISDFITPVIGDAFANKLDKGGYTGTAQNLKDDIIGLATPDIVLKEGVITVTDLTISIVANDFQWRLNQVNHLVTPAYSKLLVAATVGFKRTDILEGDSTGNYFIKQGIEGEFAAPAPAVTAGRIRLVAIPIFGSTVGTPDMGSPSENGPTDKPISVYSEFDKGISLYKDKISIWRYMGVVSKYINIYWSNINSIYDIQFPNKPAGTETFAMLSDLDSKLNITDYNNRFKGVYLTQAALISAHPTAIVGDYAQVNEVGATDVVNYNWDAEENIWVKNAVAGSGATNTDQLPEGTSNFYFTTVRVLATLVSGLSVITGGTIVSTDSVLVAFGKLQKQINDLVSGKQNKLVAGTNVTIDNTNPLSPVINSTSSTVTKAQVGLAYADNTSDIDKPLSTLQLEALNSIGYSQKIGTFINSISGLSALTISAPNTTYSFANKVLSVAKTTGAFQSDEFIHSLYGASCFENFDLEIQAVCRVSGLGIAPFLKSPQLSYKFSWNGRQTATGLTISSTAGDGTTWSDRSVNNSIVTIGVNDLVSFKMSRLKNKMTFTIQNLSTLEIATLSFVSNYNEVNNCQPTMFKYGFQVLGGTWDITSFYAKTNQLKNVDNLFVGDSITQGFSTDTSTVVLNNSSSRYFDLLNNMTQAKNVNHSAGGAQIIDMQGTIEEIKLLNPKNVFVMLGTNGQDQTAYSNFISSLVNLGYYVIPQTIPPTFGTFNAWIKSTYTKTIDTCSELFTSANSSLTTWNATYQGYAGHPNVTGQKTMYTILINYLNSLFLSIPSFSSLIENATSIQLSWGQIPNNTGYKIQFSLDGTSWADLVSTSVNTNSYTHTGLTTGQSYYYKVMALGNSTYSSSAYSLVFAGVTASTQFLGNYENMTGSLFTTTLNRKLPSGVDGWVKFSVGAYTLNEVDRVVLGLRHDNLTSGGNNLYHEYMFWFLNDEKIHTSSLSADIAPAVISYRLYQWVRLRRSSGVVYYEYSNDNVSWIVITSISDTSDLYAQIMFLAGYTKIRSVTVSSGFVTV